MIKNEKFTILYARLSREDEKDGVSNSIENQQMILEKYAKDNGFENLKFMYDDGVRGTTLDRPAWNEVMQLIKNGQVSTLIIKDISRLTRISNTLTDLIEDVFPDNNVRFISIGDNVDTKYEVDDFLPFRGLFNEMYAKDCSKKQRQVRKARAESGKPVRARVSFGYQKKSSNPQEIEIDEDAALTVRRIFELCAKGLGPNLIATKLEEEKHLNPSNHYYKKNGIVVKGLNLDDPYKWYSSAIARFLDNEIYLGHTNSLKTVVKSFKDKRRIDKPKEEWVKFENTHDAIISEELWRIAQDVRKAKKRTRKNMDEPHLFSGIVFCADCGGYLTLHRSRNTDKSKNSFACSVYKRFGKESCESTHYIREHQLETAVLDDLKRITHFARQNEKLFLERISMKSQAETNEKMHLTCTQ